MENLLSKLRAYDVGIDVVDDELQLEIPKGIDLGSIIIEIRQNKKVLIDYIKRVKEGANFSAISPAPSQSYYVLSSAQRRLYFLYRFDAGSTTYNMPQVVRLEGALDAARLAGAFQRLVDRHQSLRTRFEEVDDEPMQQVVEGVDFRLEEFDLQEEGEVSGIIQAFIRPFDLGEAPLIRVGLIRQSATEHVLLVDMHHIISDGVSQGVLVQDFMRLYQGEVLPALSLQYQDYAEWQQSEGQQAVLKEQKQYWLGQYGELPEALVLPTDYVRPKIQSHRGAVVGFRLGQSETSKLRGLAEREGTTLYMVLLSAFNVLLSKLSNQEDVVVGTPVAGRGHADLEGVMGMFVNTLPLRNYVAGGLSFREFLHQVQERTLGAFEHQGYQYEELISELGVERDTSRNPLFDVLFSYQNFEGGRLALPGLRLSSYESGHQVAKFDLSLTVSEGEELYCNLSYATALYEEGTIRRFVNYFERIVSAIVADVDRPLKEIEILSVDEKQQLLETFNDTAVDYPQEKTVIDLFEEQVTLHKDDVALVMGDRNLSYGAFLEKIDQLVAYLREKGIRQGDVVGVLYERSFEMMTALYGIMKAGAVYLPLSPSYPQERIRYILNDSHVRLVLGANNYKGMIPSRIELVDLSDLSYRRVQAEKNASRADEVAYIIYTSGSTGQPKGVMIRHRSLVNRLYWMQSAYPLQKEDILVQKTPVVFDVSLWELLWWSQQGASLYLLHPGEEKDPKLMCRAIRRRRVSTIHFVPSMLRVFLDHVEEFDDRATLESLRQVFCSGEALQPSQVNRFNKLLRDSNQTKLINLYGPTEATVDVSYYNCYEEQAYSRVPIGKPINNTSLYILSRYGNLQPLGVAGELVVGGAGVAVGYVNNEQLTSEKFVDNPFRMGEKMYRTGDMARWLADGNLEFLGRLDDQVKIRGFRIELGEIAHQLLGHEAIKEAVVVAVAQGGEQQLVAYYVSEQAIAVSQLRGHLSEALPDYMVPSYFVRLDQLPLTANGKVDRKALPPPEVVQPEEYVGPATETEERLVSIWSQVLKLAGDQLSVNKSFFELGGHSLRAMLLVNKIHKELEVTVPLKAVFAHQDIRSLARFIDQQASSQYVAIPQAEEKPYYVLSSAQRRLYFLYRFDAGSTTYNMPQVVRLEGALDVARLAGAFQRLVDRHQSLRTRFEEVDDEPMQQVVEGVDFRLEEFDLQEEGEVSGIIQAFIRPFDLGEAPLIRVGLIRQSATEHVLLVDMHHIISDGVSQGVLVQDFMRLYQGEVLPALSLQYQDYAEWQQSEGQQAVLKEQKQYWLGQYGELPEALVLPTDYVRPKIQSHRGAVVGFRLGQSETSKLRGLAEREGTTLYMVLLSAFNVLLSKLSNQEDVVVGTPVAGRGHADLEGVMGMFVNTLPLRNYVAGGLSFREFLHQVQERTLGAFEHQGYQYEELISELGVERDTSRNPLFDVLFSYQNFEGGRLALPGLRLSSYESGHQVAKFDLSLTVSEGEELYCNLSYATDLFTEATINRFVSYFRRVVEGVIRDTNQLIFEINILPDQEREELLYSFNNTTADYPEEESLVALFEEQVRRSPEDLALIYEEQRMSYAALDTRTNQLARHLIGLDCGPGSIVGLLMDRSIEQMVSLLAILKTGAAYLPIGADFPEQRVRHMLQDSQAKVLVSEGTWLSQYQDQVAVVDVHDQAVYGQDTSGLGVSYSSSQLAYVIYTSGSTGRPKGVMVTHQSVVNLVCAQQQSYGIEEEERILQFSTFTFDASVEQMWLAWLSGSALILISKDIALDEDRFGTYLNYHKVTHLHATPTFLESIKLPLVSTLRRVVSGGEECSRRLAEKFYPQYAFYNKYGPTETTVTSLIYCYDSSTDERARVPVGRPLSNYWVYVLGKQDQVQPLGVAGELVVGGAGVAQGYVNNEQLTSEKFVDNPFRMGEKMYRTGDMARWLADGNLEFLGRLDDQVKIRGFRIELGEIAHQLLGHEAIKEAVVVAVAQGGEQQLVAYYVSEQAIAVSQLRGHLSEALPDYMVPSYFVRLDQLPLTANGKVDRKALPPPEVVQPEEYVGPATETEERLVSIWSQVLKLAGDQLSVNKSFFELGGHSLRAMLLVNKIHKELEVTVPLKAVFAHQDIRSLARFIDQQASSQYVAIPQAEEKPYYVLSSAQRRLYFLYRFDAGSTTYNMPQVVRLEGALDVARLAGAFQRLVDRHQSLRTRFEEVDDEPMQQVVEGVDFRLEEFDLQEEGEVSGIIQAFIRPFDLGEAPLIRVGLIRQSATEHVLLVDMHHIISDGVSQGVLVQDFMRLYQGEVLPALSLQYQDYAEWQQSEGQQAVLKEQKQYWLGQYGELPEALVLPTDYVRPKIQSHRGAVVGFRLGQSETSKLRGLAEREGTTLYMVLLSAFNVLLSKLSNQEDVVVGTPVAGRGHADLEGVMGMFVNTLPLRNYVAGGLSFREFLHQVQERTLGAFEHQGYQYEELISELGVERDTSRNPLFDVLFSYQNFEGGRLALPGLRLSSYESGHQVAKFDLSLTVSEGEEELYCNFHYSTDLFTKEKIDKFAYGFEKVVSAYLDSPTTKLSTLSILTEGDRLRLLDTFNDTTTEYAQQETLISLFEEQVRQTPDELAVCYADQSLSYKELKDKVDTLCGHLIGKGIGVGDTVGVLADRSVSMIISMLGIMKSGGSYLPLDDDQPLERLSYMISQSEVRLVLEPRAGVSKVAGHVETVGVQEVLSEDLSDRCPPEISLLPEGVAYVIYTSGSSGKPKGVRVSHRSVVNYVTAQRSNYRVDGSDRILQFTTATFDPSVEQVWLAFLSGAALVLIDKDTLSDSARFSQYIADQRITHLHATPSFLESVEIEGPNCLRRIVSGGEACSASLVRRFAGGLDFYNKYGPTEATISATAGLIKGDINEGDRISIGKPLQNTFIYLLGLNGELVYPGTTGEVYIGGAGVAVGYVNNEQLTSEKFVDNPFRMGEKMYRTGDMARWLADGNLEFLGRLDDQVKIRGFRIELGEIAHQLLGHEAIKEAVVVTKGEGADQYLVGYYVADEGVVSAALKSYLSEQLPSYMVPSYFVRLDQLPLTANGKVDRKALPPPEVVQPEEYVGPVTETEERLVSIWSQVLKLAGDQLSVNKSFFELGGHSLRAMLLVNKIHKELEVTVPLKAVFAHQDIRSLARFIDQQASSQYVAIPQAEEKPYYVLSSAQRRLYFLYRFDAGSTTYNMPQVVRLEGALDVARLAGAFQRLVDRHQSLRTRFEEVDDEPMQQVVEGVDFRLEEFDLQEEGEVSGIIQAFIRPFDLGEAPLIRVGLIRQSATEHVLLVDMHHIISDGVSQGVLVQDFMRLYQGEVLPALSLQYQDYAEWQQSEGQQAVLKEQKQYWLGQYGELPEALVLPTDYVRPKIQSHRGAVVGFRLGQSETSKLRGLAEREGTTLYMVLLSAFNVLLSKLSNQEDVVVGTPVAGRGHADLEGVMGMFVNTLPLRNYVAGGLSFREFLHQVQERTLGAFEHQGYQYEELISELGVERDTSRNPLFDVLFSYQNFEGGRLALPGLRLSSYESGHQVAKFDLSLTVSEGTDGLRFLFKYSTDLFSRESIYRFGLFYKRILTCVGIGPEAMLSSITLIDSKEKEQILTVFNATAIPYPRLESIVSLFELQVTQTPSALALQDGTERWSYEDLNRRANQVAYFLQSVGLEQEERVGVIAGRSAGGVIAMLGILKAGGAYLPLDVAFPRSRIDQMLSDGGVKIALCAQGYEPHLPVGVQTSSVQEAGIDLPVHNPAQQIEAKSLAYVIYTSGSTGTPKGVAVTHQNVVRLVKSTTYVELNNSTRILQTGAPTFDATTMEIWGSLLNGGRLYLVDKEVLLQTGQLGYYLHKYAINTLWLTSPLFDQHASEDPQIFFPLKYLLIGGDKLTPRSVNKVREMHSDLQLINGYGPTENTTFSVCYSINQNYDDNIPIGKPIGNSTAYVVDKDGNLQPVGIAGELVVGGAGVAKGYLNRPGLTAEKFVDNPYRTGEKMYRTGDMARWLADGNLEFLGRLDDQVKIRGFRIELGEIAHQLLGHEAIKEAVVVAVAQGGEQQLVAYYVSEQAIAVSQLRGHLSEALPDYMVPSYFVRLDQLPLTANGKVDRKALPPPEVVQPEEYVGPATETEERLVSIWSQVLKLAGDQLSVNKSFFELGGHSLRAMLLVNKIHKELEVTVPLKAVFAHQDIRSLARFIDQQASSQYVAIPQAEEKPYYVLSSAQRRLYFLYRFDAGSTTYNMPQVVRLEGALDVARLAGAFQRLVDRHQSLRTRFEEVDDEPMQQVVEGVDFRLEEFDLQEEGEVSGIIQAFIRPFDLGEAPLIRVGLIRQSATEHVLLVDMHHIISDGVSQGVLVQDFMRLYQGEVLPALSLQYQDYAEWQQSEGQQAVLKEQKQYWLGQYGELPEALVLPTDYVRPKIQSHRGAVVGFRLGQSETSKLRGLAEREGTTLYMVLLSAFNVLLSKLSNQEDVVVGTPVAGRGHADLEGVMGMFVNTLPLRNYVAGGLSFREFLHQVQERTLGAFEHQGYQYEELISELGVERDTSRNPLFDVLFSYQNFEGGRLALPGLRLSSYESGHQVAKFDLSLTVSEGEELYCNLSYATALYEEGTIRRFVNYFERIVSAIVADVDRPLKEIEILSVDEKQQLLETFNDTAVDYPQEKTVIDLFEEQVRQTPDAVAITLGDEYLSYKKLNRKANALARKVNHGTYRNKKYVPVLMSKCIEFPLSILSILKLGLAYVPLDVNWPLNRIKEVIKELDSDIILVDSHSHELLANDDLLSSLSLVVTNKDLNDTDKNPKYKVSIEEPIYITYTSGTTGKPKGAINHQKGILNRLLYMNKRYEIKQNDVVLATSNNAFDTAVWQFLWPLINGNKVVIPPSEHSITTLSDIVDLIEKEKITVTDFVPSVFNLLVSSIENKNEVIKNKLTTLRQLILGGETISPIHVFKFKKLFPEVGITNAYGPCEASIGTVFYEVSSTYSDPIPIGKPIDNVVCLVLDKNGNNVPIGTTGELYLGGICVGLGYFKDVEKTKNSFVRLDINNYRNQVFYKTGDLVKYLPDGNLIFMGRKDHQVKIRGIRIEVREIEKQLLDVKQIKEAAVIAKGSGEDKYLIAYYSSKTRVEVPILRSLLSKNLPDYMMPTYFVEVTKMPLTANGKLNRKALPEPELAIEDYVAPSHEAEEQLVSIWSEVLKLDREQISVTKSFFELGGHSLRAMILMSKMRKVLGVEMPLTEFFARPTIKAVVQSVQQRKNAELRGSDLVVLLKQGSDTEKNLFFIHDGSGDIQGYKELVNLIEGYSCWGIRSESLNRFGPKSVEMKEIAEDYLTKIRGLQPEGPYNLVGWSFGGTVAYEMLKQLESSDVADTTLYIIDSRFHELKTKSAEDDNTFSLANEKIILGKALNSKLLGLENAASIEEVWKQVASYLKNKKEDVEAVKNMLPKNMRRLIPHFDNIEIEHLIIQVNTIRTLHYAAERYYFEGTLRVKSVYFKAKDTNHDIEFLANHFEDITCFEVTGDHFSILQEPSVQEIAYTIQNALKES